MEKRKLVISYKNLTPELLALLKQKYPYGYHNHVIKVTKPNNDFFHAITLDTEDASYLVKVNVKIDTKPKDEDEEKGFFSDSDDIGTDEDTFPEEEEEQAEDYED
jgi:hypothetical protein